MKLTRKGAQMSEKFFAPTVPVNILEGLVKDGEAGGYQFLLAHDVVKNPVRWKELRKNNDFDEIILDNSCIELGAAVNLEMVKEAVEICHPTVVILPDVLEKAVSTVESIGANLDSWRRAMPDQSFMIVPQGKTIEHFTWCAEQLLKLEPIFGAGFLYWGIPRNLVPLHGSRAEAIRVCHTLDPYMKIHLLGFSDDFIDDILCTQMEGVSGIDSAVPCRIVNHNIPLSMVMKVPPRGSWWDSAVYDTQMAVNCGKIREWINVTASD